MVPPASSSLSLLGGLFYRIRFTGRVGLGSVFTAIWRVKVGRGLGCCVVVILTILLRSMAVGTTGASCVVRSPSRRRYFVSRTAPTDQGVLRHFRFCYAVVPYRVKRTSVSRMPASGDFVHPRVVFRGCEVEGGPFSIRSGRSRACGPSSPLACCICKLEGVVVWEIADRR